MIHQNAITAILAILSIAALAGVFTVQIADAQLPFLSVDDSGVGFQSEELRFSVRGQLEEGVPLRMLTEEFDLAVLPTGVAIIPFE
jgi:hypothetical protein